MVVVQWNTQKISRTCLEAHGWHFIREVSPGWIEMGLGEE